MNLDRLYKLSLFLALFFMLPGFGYGQEATALHLMNQKLLRQLQHYNDKGSGVIGVAAWDPFTHTRIEFQASSQFPQASTIKFPILLEAYRQIAKGNQNEDTIHTISKRYLVGGGGVIQKELRKQNSIQRSFYQLCRVMMVESDNIATNYLIDLLGMDNINQSMRSWGLNKTLLQRRMMDVNASAQGQENISTPSEMLHLLIMLYDGKILPQKETKKVLTILGLVQKYMRKAIPAHIPIASKAGRVPGVLCETGIIYLPKGPVFVSIMSSYNPIQGKNNPVIDITRLLFSHFSYIRQYNTYGHSAKGYR